MKKNKKPEKLSLQSLSITEEQKKKLKQVFPEVFNEAKIDWEKLKATLGEELDSGHERYNMNWPGKRDCFRIIQEPSFGALKPCKKESLDWDKTQNLFIEGDNLEVLKLLQRSYYNKVKMIYIDPPYNTGKDFIYPDNYSETLDTYLKYTDQKDTEGKKFSTNQETDGRFHSKWINMMYPRLFLARNLLREDGVIFISIDDNEVTNLRKICDEIFGEENFVASIIWQKKYAPQNDSKWFTDNHDYIILYSKNKGKWDINPLPRTEKQNKYYVNDDNDGKGLWRTDNILVKSYTKDRVFPIKNPKTNEDFFPPKGRCWRYSKMTINNMLKENRLYFGKDGLGGPQVKRYLKEVKDGVTPLTIWTRDEVGDNQEGKNETNQLFNGFIFDTPKVIRLIQRMIHVSGKQENSIILDFFAGSATTAHAIYEKNLEDGGNRKYICVQLPEPTQENTEAYKAGYKNIADIGKERIRRAVKKIKEDNKQQSLLDQNKNNLDLGFKVFKLDKSNFKVWNEEISKDKQAEKQVEMHLEDSINPNSSEEDLLYEILIKTGYELTTPVKSLKLAGKKVYSVENNALLICLDRKITKDLIIEMAKLKPARIVCLDIGFDNNDHLKTDAMETFKSHGVIDFKTI